MDNLLEKILDRVADALRFPTVTNGEGAVDGVA